MPAPENSQNERCEKVPLRELWGEIHDATFKRIKILLARSVHLPHMKEENELCLFSDASDAFWAAVLRQVPNDQLARDLEKMEHVELAFLSGRFSGHSECWSTLDKEGSAVVESMTKPDLLTAIKEVHIYTDRANLVCIFDPFGHKPTISRKMAHKLTRWALRLAAYHYVIEHVLGDRNVCADLLTLWANGAT